MYLEFFSMNHSPFGVTPDTRFLYLSPQHEDALATLLYGIRERRGFMILTGEVGTGKSTTIRALLNELKNDVETSLVLNPLLSTDELVKTISRDFGCAVAETDNVQTVLEHLNLFLLENDQKGRNAVVIIDESQNLSLESLEMVRLLSNLETETHKLIQIVLVGQPELETKLADPALRQLRQRIQIAHRLHPLNCEETKNYVIHRVKQSGPKCCIVFQSTALKKIYEYTSGFPRLINTLGELMLVTAFTKETHVITNAIVDQAFKEMLDKSWQKVPLWKKVLGIGGKEPRHVNNT
ncbi:MAG: AAA family ATPase [Deltaproteobacteria bacterium]|nr:MAG: AAA family ATPase [Deltaproteobacteria bacterium]